MTAYTKKNNRLVEEDAGIHHEYYECMCDSEEHVLRITYFMNDDNSLDEFEEIYITTFLGYQGFWRRLWGGLKYIFGYNSKYGHFECTTLKVSDAIRFRDLLNRFLESKNRPILKLEVKDE